MSSGRCGKSVGSFELVDHTAEVGIVARGADLAEALEQASMGMLSLIVDSATVEGREEREVEASAPDSEALVVEWLNELLYLFEAGGFVPLRCRVSRCNGRAARGVCTGEPPDPSRHRFLHEVKAATYHRLLVAYEDHEWRVRVFLDV